MDTGLASDYVTLTWELHVRRYVGRAEQVVVNIRAPEFGTTVSLQLFPEQYKQFAQAIMHDVLLRSE